MMHHFKQMWISIGFFILSKKNYAIIRTFIDEFMPDRC